MTGPHLCLHHVVETPIKRPTQVQIIHMPLRPPPHDHLRTHVSDVFRRRLPRFKTAPDTADKTSPAAPPAAAAAAAAVVVFPFTLRERCALVPTVQWCM